MAPNIIRVPLAEQMHDEALICHLEKRHPHALKLKFVPEPERVAAGKPRRLLARLAWEAFHGVLHASGKHRHVHVEVEPDASSGNGSVGTRLRAEEEVKREGQR